MLTMKEKLVLAYRRQHKTEEIHEKCGEHTAREPRREQVLIDTIQEDF